MKKEKEIIQLVKELTDYFGNRSKDKATFMWKHREIIVMINNDHKYMIITYNNMVVYGNLIKDNIIFEPGKWIDLIQDLHSQKLSDMKKLNNYFEIGPMVEIN